MPLEVLLLLIGIVVGVILHVRLPFDFAPALFFVFLPPLIFEAAWALDMREVLGNAGRIVFLALPGTLLTAFAIALGVAWLGIMPFAQALLLGAILSATDPVAVVAVFRSAKVPANVSTIVETESLANDGIAVALYTAGSALLAGAAPPFGTVTFDAAYQIIGGTIVGAACAVPFAYAVRLICSAWYEVVATVALAYVSYLAAFELHASAIFAAAAAAIVMRRLIHGGASAEEHKASAFLRTTAFIANAVVFLWAGFVMQPAGMVQAVGPLAATIALMVLIRVALAWLTGTNRGQRILIFLAGMRGGLPLALALSLPAVTARTQIIAIVSGAVVLTLVAPGLLLRPVTERFVGRAASE